VPLASRARSAARPLRSTTEADGATKRALFDVLDLRVVYDKASHRLSISATLTEAVRGKELRGWDSNPQPLD